MNLVLKNCKIVVNGNEFEKHISIVNGKIERLTPTDINIVPDRNTKVIDVEGKYVLPGVIDSHVHFRDPGLIHKEDFLTGSKAAAKGGVTTVLDMPNTDPLTITVENLAEKREIAKKSVVNYGFHFGASKEDNIEEIKKVSNVASTKVFMNVSTGMMLIEEDELLKDVFRNSPMVAVHAEGEMVEKAIKYVKDYGKELYICHVSSEDEALLIKEAKDAGKKVYCEVTPHHLYLTEDDIDSKNPGMLSMMPGLKTEKDKDALWQLINDGVVDTIGTDHAPHTIREKKGKEFCYGVPGVETSLPLMLNAVNEGKITLWKLQELMCQNPAKIFGIKNKGYLNNDFDADLVVIDLEKEGEILNEDIVSKCGWTPFNKMKVKGWPVMTIVNGNIIYDGEMIHDIKGNEVEFE